MGIFKEDFPWAVPGRTETEQGAGCKRPLMFGDLGFQNRWSPVSSRFLWIWVETLLAQQHSEE